MYEIDMENILLVDDRPENLIALEAILENREYNLIKATSGEEALKYLLKYDISTILLDVQMPEMDGFATAKIIKTRERTKNIPIIFITANYMDSEHIFTGYSIGAIDYILKPFDPVILKAKVAGFVDIFKLHKKLINQAKMLTLKTLELEKTCNELSLITSKLQISEALANVTRETTIDSMIITDNKGKILKVNPAVKTMFKYEESEILDRHISLLFSNESDIRYLNKIFESINEGDAANLDAEIPKEFIALKKDGSHFNAELQIGFKLVNNMYLIACTIRDITKRKRDEELIKHMAYHDNLTNLPNRVSFRERLTSELEFAKINNQSFVIMHLNMDLFKFINDTLGHQIGDKLLQEYAIRLQRCTRKNDFVARIGGDEFNILLPDTDRETAIEIAEKVLEDIQEPFSIDGFELYVTSCIGASVYPYDGFDATNLLKSAGAALHHAKKSGKNQYNIYHNGMNLQSYRSFMLQNDLRKAIDNNELYLVYQPRIDIDTNHITSLEALIRWNHPNLGLISPGEFIPLAETSGRIIEIGDWVLRTACKQSKIWQEAGLPVVRIAVNFSSQQFMQKNLVGNLKQILKQEGLSADRIEIEITESIILENEERVINTLKQIREMGIWISIDDFGTGYSSLNYLRKYPVNSIKIDKCFIQDLSNDNTTNTALITTIISMSHSLNMSVVAEGVETREQLEILNKQKCDEVQGFLFSPPVSTKDIEVLLSTGITNEDKITVTNDKTTSYRVPLIIEQNNQKVINKALQHAKNLYSMSQLEEEIFELIINGFTNKEIAKKLSISEDTTKSHILQIFEKINVDDRIQAIAEVYEIFVGILKSLCA